MFVTSVQVQKVRNFFRHFRTDILQIPAFFLAPKTVDSCGSHRHALVCHTKSVENLRNSDGGPFLEINIKSKKMPPSAR